MYQTDIWLYGCIVIFKFISYIFNLVILFIYVLCNNYKCLFRLVIFVFLVNVI